MKKEEKMSPKKVITVLVLLVAIGFGWGSVFKYLGIISGPVGQNAQVYSAVTSPVTPDIYFQFDGTNVQASSVGTATFGDGSQSSLINSYKKTGGMVGNYLEMPFSITAPTPQISMGTVTGVTNQLSVQMLYQMGESRETYFVRSADFDIGITQPKKDIESSTSISEINFSTKNSAGAWDTLKLTLNGVDRKSISYYYQQPRLLTFVYDNGVKTIYVDGLPVESKQGSASLGSSQSFVVGSNTAYRTVFAKVMDEVAIYKKAIPGNLAYQNFLDISSGAHYSYTTNITSVNNPPSFTAGLNPNEFLPGAVLNSDLNSYTNYGGQTPPSLLTQLKTFPSARYNKNSTLERNVLWDDLDYLYAPNPTSHTNNRETITAWGGVDMSKELYNNWNFRYPLAVINESNLTLTPNDYIKKSLDYLNTEISAGKTVYVAALTNISYGPKLSKVKNLGTQYCLQDSSGDKINYNGAKDSTICQWKPTTATTFFNEDGLFFKNSFLTIKNQVSNLSKFNLHVIDNDETTGTADPNGLSKDPAVVSAANSAGLSLSEYEASRYAAIFNNYKAKFLTDNGFTNSSFAVYAHDGSSSNRKTTFPRFNWTKVREMQRQIGTNRYATPDIYYRYQGQWANTHSADHGLNWALYTAFEQHQSGDKFFSPFVNQGWWENQTYNILPSNYLGGLKILNNLGAEYSYVSYFNQVPSANNVVGWPQSRVAYVVLPTYAQAPFTRFDSFYKNSDVMVGDLPLRYEYWNNDPKGYEFATDAPGDSMVIVRKSNTENKYMISATLQPTSNMDGATPDVRPISIKLGGQKITFDARRQGSIYYFDNTNTSAPKFYQLDSWHEASHPWYWSKNISIEAEMYDSGSATITTEGSGVASRNFSGSNYDTYITGGADYKFEPKSATNSNVSYPAFLARVKSGNGSSATGTFKVDSSTATFSISTNSSSYCWAKVDNNSLLQNLTANTEHTLNYLGSDSNLKLDKIVLSTTSNVSGYTLCSAQVVVDQTAPTAPTQITASGVTSDTATLSWTASTDNVSVTGYKIYKNSVYLATSQTANYSTSGLTPSTAYLFEISAIDAAGNESSKASKSITTIAGTQTSCVGNPDLVVLDFKTTPANPSAGDMVTLQAQVKNNGCSTPIGTISGSSNSSLNGTPYKTGVLFTILNGVTQLPEYFYSDNYTNSINKDEVVWITANSGSQGRGSWPAVAGSYTMSVIVDDINRITESNESNNQFDKSFSVASQSVLTLTMNSPITGSEYTKGSSIDLSVNVTGNTSAVKKVKFVAQKAGNDNAKEIVRCSDVTAPYDSCTWANVGSWLQLNQVIFNVKAVAYGDKDTVLATSNTITVKVNP